MSLTSALAGSKGAEKEKPFHGTIQTLETFDFTSDDPLAGSKRNFQVFDPLGFLAEPTKRTCSLFASFNSPRPITLALEIARQDSRLGRLPRPPKARIFIGRRMRRGFFLCKRPRTTKVSSSAKNQISITN